MPADIVFTPPHISHMTPRTLRAANAVLYATSTLLVIATVIYCAFYKQMAAWQLWSAIGLGAVATVWGLYYVTLCYRVTSEGISRHVFLRRTHYLRWVDITHTDIAETDSNGVASCTISLQTADNTALSLSSDVLHLDDVQELAGEIRESIVPH